MADQVLMAPDATPARVAIPWLHIIREHPVFLENYENLFLAEKTIIDWIRKYTRSIHDKLSLLKTLLKSFFSPDISEWSETIEYLLPKDVLFISHLLNKTQIENQVDSYFSDLPLKLNDGCYQSLVVMLNHTKI